MNDAAVRGFRQQATGGIVGHDLLRDEHRRAGLAIEVGRGRLDSAGADRARARLEDLRVHAYGRYAAGDWETTMQLQHGWTKANLARHLDFLAAPEAIIARAGAQTTLVSLRAARPLQWHGFTLRPSIGFDYRTARLSGTDEGGGEFSLEVHGGDVERSDFVFGVDASRRFGRRLPLELSASASYVLPSSTTPASAQVSLAAPGSPAFALQGLRPREQWAKVRALAVLHTHRSAQLYLSVENNPLSEAKHGYTLGSGLIARW